MVFTVPAGSEKNGEKKGEKNGEKKRSPFLNPCPGFALGRTLNSNSVGCEETFPGLDIEDENLEVLKAIEAYKHRTGNKFPSYTELLNLLWRLGGVWVRRSTDWRKNSCT